MSDSTPPDRADRSGDAPLVADDDAAVAPHAAGGGRVKRSSRWKKVLLIGTGTLVVAAGLLWAQRVAISDELIRQQLDDRGIAARYDIQAIGLRTQRLTNVVIGRPGRPDLVAKSLEMTLHWGLSGPTIDSVRADGLRLLGRYRDGKISFGELDKFSDPTSDKPFTLPDFYARLDDARLSIVTPWANIGASLNGAGNLRRNFNGKLAFLAPSLQLGGCAGQRAVFQGDVRIRRAEPQLIGPMTLDSLTCAAQDLRLAQVRVGLDAGISEDISRWRGRVDAVLPSVKMAAMTAHDATVGGRFSGTAKRTELDVAASVKRWTAPQGQGLAATLNFAGYMGSEGQAIEGEAKMIRASLASSLRQRLVQGGSSLSSTPVGPVALQAGRAASTALADFSASAEFALLGDGDAAEFTLANLQLRSGGGGQVTSSADSRVSYKMGGDGSTWTMNGEWDVRGGGLPHLSAQLQRKASGQVDGQLVMAPYLAGNSMLAMGPLRVSGAGDGNYRFDGQLRLSGPVGDGRIESANIPLKGRWGRNGVLALDAGCHKLDAQMILVGGYHVDQPRLSLCSAAGRPLMAMGPQGLSGQVHLPQLALRGLSKDGSQLDIRAGRSEVDLASGRWTARDAMVRLSASNAGTANSAAIAKDQPTGDGTSDQPNQDVPPAVPTLFTAQRIEGRREGGVMVGSLSGAEGRIGAVPLNMGQIDGAWQWANGALTLDGHMRLTDASDDPRFQPLIAPAATLRFENGRITAHAAFQEERSNRPIVDADIVHQFDGSGGTAKLSVKELRFDEQFQPDQLTRLALGVVANVDGAIVGDGIIRWSDIGVTSTGTFATAHTNLAAAFGPVRDLSGTIIFDDLLNLRTAPKQIVTIGEINPGIAVLDGKVEYMLTGNQTVRIEGGRWPLASGELRLHPATLNFGVEETRHLNFELVGIDAAHLMQSFDFENLNVTGVFDGSLPVEFGGLGGRIVDGRVDSRPGGGNIAYVGELSNRNLGAMANFAFGALRSLNYSELSIVLNGELDGEMVTDIRFGGVGQGEGATQNFLTRQIARIPMIFNVKISAPFRSIFTTVRGLYDPSVQIEQNLPELMRRQEEMEQQVEQQNKLVQPSASEPVQ